MAQALFDDHPIEHYLRESGEMFEPMPGGLEEFSRLPPYDDVLNNFTIYQEWLVRMADTIQTLLKFTGLSRPSAASEFAERFKYIVISSSLLSSSLPLSPLNRATTPTTPGHYDQNKPSLHSTTSTIYPTVSSMVSQFSVLLLALLVPSAMGRSYLLGFLLLGVAMILSDRGLGAPSASVAKSNTNESWTTTLTILDSLVVANNTWDSAVSEAFAVLDNEEQTSFPSSFPTSPLSSFRIALSSCLNTTQLQCDNVRQLLAALTSPLMLSQLSHMYAPPSPSRRSASPLGTRPKLVGTGPPSPAHSRLSSPDESCSRARADKRSTWTSSSWSHASGPPPPQLSRRSRLSTSILAETVKPPMSPTFMPFVGASLELVPSLVNSTLSEDSTSDADAEDEPFGVAALDLCRKRRKAHLLASDMSTPSASLPVLVSSGSSSSRLSPAQNSPLTSSFGSRFTSFTPASHASRQTQPLSLSNLHLALQGAVGSKRFVCAHLLALRFPDPPDAQSMTSLGSDGGSDMEGEDGVYWEDVRSIISILTSTLEDVSSRLMEALADTVRRQQEESVALSKEEPHPNLASPLHVETGRGSMSVPVSFAPIPSHLTRFAAHVEAITSALDEAREHLRQCVASLREDGEYDAPLGGVVNPDLSLPPSPAAIQSYEQLRRELGFALRECERGGRTLQDSVEQWRRRLDGSAAEEGGDETLSMRHEEQLSSGESEKTLFNQDETSDVHKYPREDGDPFGAELLHLPLPSPSSTTVTAGSTDHQGGGDGDGDADDATGHLLQMTSSAHLPPPGIEQVFESSSVAAAPFLRERSKLTREERIRLVKARRERERRAAGSGGRGRGLDGGGNDDDDAMASLPNLELEPEPEEPPLVREGWGPGGEVVQELKNVIRKVSEQRRKMVERSAGSLGMGMGLRPDHDVRVPSPSGIA